MKDEINVKCWGVSLEIRDSLDDAAGVDDVAHEWHEQQRRHEDQRVPQRGVAGGRRQYQEVGEVEGRVHAVQKHHALHDPKI